MAGSLSSSQTSKRKPPHPNKSSSPKHRVSNSIVSLSDSAHANANSHRSSSSHGKFSYPETRRRTKSENALKSSSSKHSASSNKHYVFVYGTLKKGFANAHLLDRATHLGDFRTLTRYPLVVGGKYNSPYLLDMPAQGSKVKGEVYAVDDATLADLDHLENVGVNYMRKVTKVSNCADRSFVADVYVYFKTNGLDELSKSEYLEDYQCRRYVPRHMRKKETSSTPALVSSGR